MDDFSLVPVEHDPFADVPGVGFVPTAVPPMAASMARGVANQLMAPGNVAQGYQPQVPGQWSDVDEATAQLNARGQYDWAPQQALNMVGSGTPFAEAGAAGIFGGKLAKTADLAALDRAQTMAAQGATRDAIWNQTGWFQGADQKWRFEIPDNAAQMNPHSYPGPGMPPENTSLIAGQIWHPDLYRAYPQLRGIEATISPRSPTAVGATGRYWPGFEEGDAPALQISASTPAQAHSTALHELQHGVQFIEDFAKGSQADVLIPNTPAWDIYQERLQAIRDSGNVSREDFSKQAGYGDELAPIKDYQNFVKSTRNISPMVDHAAQEYAVREAYNRSAGEVESTNVQRRLFMTPEERQAAPPWTTERVPTDQQIVTMRAHGPQTVFEENNDPVTKGIRAFHGSPYDFDRFDLSKIGTGEGAQAYGHGLYFAENPAVAQQYRDNLAGSALEINGKRFVPLAGSPEDIALAHLEDAAARGSSDPYPSAMTDLLIKAERPYAKKDDYKAAVDVLKKWDDAGATLASKGKSYEVNIAADPEHFLDWDKPLSEQSPQVLSILKNHPSFETIRDDDTLSKLMPRQIAPSTETGIQYFRQAGIPGIKYLDQGSRLNLSSDAGRNANHLVGKMGQNGALNYAQGNLEAAGSEEAKQYWSDTVKELSKAPTSNFVVFDDNLISIIRKYGLAGLIAGGASHFALSPVDHDPFPEERTVTAP